MSNRTPRDGDELRVRRALSNSFGTRYGYTVPNEATVPSLRTLTAASSAADVRSFVITFIRDLQNEGKVSQ